MAQIWLPVMNPRQSLMAGARLTRRAVDVFKFDDIFSRLDTIPERDRRTDTGQQQRPRLRIASRGKTVQEQNA